jgi:site-specific recombinase XerC/ribosomal protein L40E
VNDDEIYGYEHRLELVLTGPHGIKESKDILKANKKVLLEYHTFLKTRRLSLPRQEKLMKALKRLAELLGSKQFKDVTREDMEKLIGNMKPKRKGSSRKELADSTLRDFQIIVRQFYSWLYHSPKRQYPDVVSWMEPKEPRPKLQASDLLTPEEKDRLKAATPNRRDKALMSCFDEAGPRPGELLNVRLKNVRIESTWAEIDVDGKTGQRVVHIISAFSDLVNWLDAHPQKDNPEAYLWSVSPDGKPFKYDQARNRLLNIARKAGVKRKRVYLYLLRHGSVTQNAKTLPDQLLKKRYGWAKGSRAIEFYDHLTSTDLKDALLQQAGLTGEKKREEPSVILCPRCKAPNPVGASLCFRCKSALTLEKALRIEELQQKISKLENLEERIGKLEDELVVARATGGKPWTMAPEERKDFVAKQKSVMQRLEKAGYVVEE